MTHYSDEEIAAALGRLLPKKNTNGGSNTADIPNVALAHLISRCAAEIAPKRIDFTWAGRIARGKHTAIAGEPGDGKSQLSVYIALAGWGMAVQRGTCAHRQRHYPQRGGWGR
jgi:hypothetical protein